MESINDVWFEICTYLKSKVNEVVYDSWLKDLELKELKGNKATLYIKTPFQRDIINDNYKVLLDDAFLETMKFPIDVVIKTAEDYAGGDKPVLTNIEQYDYTFDNFIIGTSNHFAYAASTAVAANPGKAYNPLFIYGNSGLGKTHLLSAIAAEIKSKFPDKKVLKTNCEDFVNECIYSLQNNRMDEFREKHRNIDAILVDDIQFLAGKTAMEEEFFNTFNSLYRSEKQIVMTSDRPPKDISSISDRLRSRFEQGLLADIEPPELETRIGIIKRKAQLCNIDLSKEVIEFIADQIKTNIRQLEGIVKKLEARANLNLPITISVAQNVIREVKSTIQAEPITVERVVSEVSRTYSIDVEDIMSNKQDAPISYARQVSMYVLRIVTDMPYKLIGEKFGKNHATVMHSCNKIKEKIDSNPKEKDIINDIIKNIQNS